MTGVRRRRLLYSVHTKYRERGSLANRLPTVPLVYNADENGVKWRKAISLQVSSSGQCRPWRNRCLDSRLKRKLLRSSIAVAFHVYQCVLLVLTLL